MGPTGCAPGNDGHQERVHYFFGMLLGVADFEQEQAYFRDKHRRHNRLLHGWGVVSGFEVTPLSANGGQVAVSPGYALDPCGNEITVGAAVVVDASNQAPSFLAVRFDECIVDDRRVRDSFAMELLEEPGEPWVVLAKISTVGQGSITIDSSVRRGLKLD